MKKFFTGTLLAFSFFAAVLIGSGCQSKTEDAAAPTADQTAPQANPNVAPQMSPEAAKAAEAAMRRDKAGY